MTPKQRVLRRYPYMSCWRHPGPGMPLWIVGDKKSRMLFQCGSTPVEAWAMAVKLCDAYPAVRAG